MLFDRRNQTAFGSLRVNPSFGHKTLVGRSVRNLECFKRSSLNFRTRLES
jgi:hypothetical protein